MYIQVEVETPKNLTRRQRELLEEFEPRKPQGDQPREPRILRQGEGILRRQGQLRLARQPAATPDLQAGTMHPPFTRGYLDCFENRRKFDRYFEGHCNCILLVCCRSGDRFRLMAEVNMSMGTPHFETYNRTLRRIMWAEFLDEQLKVAR